MLIYLQDVGVFYAFVEFEDISRVLNAVKVCIHDAAPLLVPFLSPEIVY